MNTFTQVYGALREYILRWFMETSESAGMVATVGVNNYAALATYITSIGSTDTQLFLSKGTYEIGTDITLPANLKLVFARGAMLKRTGGATITLNCEIDAGIGQIFDDDGGAGSFTGNLIVKEIYPEWFGVIGDGHLGAGGTDNTAKLQLAIDLASYVRAKVKLRSRTIYNCTNITIPDYVKMEGASGFSYNNNESILQCISATPVFITITSDYRKISKLKNIAIRTLESNSKTGSTVAIRICLANTAWAAASYLSNISIYGFGVGIKMQINSYTKIKHSHVVAAGKGLVFDPYVSGSGQVIGSSFGNLNVVEQTSIKECLIGAEFYSDVQNTFRNAVFERNYIALQFHTRPGGYIAPTQHRFENCWFEYNGYDENTENGKPWVVNSDIDANLDALGTNTADLRTNEFLNCKSAFNYSQTIPTFNTDYQSYSIQLEPKTQLIYSDDTVKNIYNRSESIFHRTVFGFSSAWRTIFKTSNKGTMAKLNFNSSDYVATFTPSSTPASKTATVTYSQLTNPQPGGAGVANVTSSVALMAVTVIHEAGEVDTAVFLINDYHYSKAVNIIQLGTTLIQNAGLLTSITITYNEVAATHYNKAFIVGALGTYISSVNIKVTYLPSGLAVGLP